MSTVVIPAPEALEAGSEMAGMGSVLEQVLDGPFLLGA